MSLEKIMKLPQAEQEALADATTDKVKKTFGRRLFMPALKVAVERGVDPAELHAFALYSLSILLLEDKIVIKEVD